MIQLDRSRTTAVSLMARPLLALAALCYPSVASSQTRGPIEIAAHGGTFVGGQPVSIEGRPPRARAGSDPAHSALLDLNGQYVRGATYVEYTILARPSRPPIVMFPGGGLSAASFQDTPDGRPGWETFFLRRGYSVNLVDIDRTGRSPWRVFPEIEAQEPSFRNNAFLWEKFRIGPPGSYAPRSAYRDGRFPVGAFEVFAGQTGPRFRPAPAEQSVAYDSVIRRFCPCILLLHSAAGAPGMAAAQRFPQLVLAVVAVEPSGAPALLSVSGKIAHIFVWGDHLGSDESDASWAEQYGAAQSYAARLRSSGARVHWLDLPALGIRGNSHLLMMDRNSDEVAALIDRRLGDVIASPRKRDGR